MPRKYPTPDPPRPPPPHPHDRSPADQPARSAPDGTHDGETHPETTQQQITSNRCPSGVANGSLRQLHFPTSEGILTFTTPSQGRPNHGSGSEALCPGRRPALLRRNGRFCPDCRPTGSREASTWGALYLCLVGEQESGGKGGLRLLRGMDPPVAGSVVVEVVHSSDPRQPTLMEHRVSP